MQNEFDVVIIGAGAAGLMAALELSLTGKKVIIIEAKGRIGGRIHTITKGGELPIELGAEFVHGDLALTKDLLKKAGAHLYQMEGEIWRVHNGLLQDSDFVEDYSLLNKKFKDLTEDISVAQFLEQYLKEEKHDDLRQSLKSYVEGYYAADLSLASTFALRDELQNSSDTQYRIEEGYQPMLDHFRKELTDKGCTVHLSTPVRELRWNTNKIEVITKDKTFTAKKALITVSLGILQNEVILFSPAIQDKINAAKELGYGSAIKLILKFKEAFWKNKSLTQNKDLSSMGFLFSNERIPTWWTAHPKEEAMLTGWLGGPEAEELQVLNDDDLLQKALKSLSNIFRVEVDYLQRLLASYYTYNWSTDPYTRGAYSFEVVNGAEHKKILKQPIEEALFFAGEALHEGPEVGTVEAALITGREAAHRIVASFN